MTLIHSSCTPIQDHIISFIGKRNEPFIGEFLISRPTNIGCWGRYQYHRKISLLHLRYINFKLYLPQIICSRFHSQIYYEDIDGPIDLVD